ncbi:MAG: hypothetical protein NVSMB18_27780 [Acetobacteraceae bacterium]
MPTVRGRPGSPAASSPAANPAAILAGALLLLWPALLNRYPILFSDTGGLLQMGLDFSMGWDKPWVYGPLLALIHWRQSLWPAAAAQTLLLSYVLFLAQSVFAPPRPARQHLLVCQALAIGTAAPWVASTLMPDLFTPVTVLSLFTLAYAPQRLPRAHRRAAALIATVAIAAHLSNLIVAAACLAALALLRRAIPWRPAASLAAALAFLLASNVIGHGKLAISPYGSVFALARLIGDGPARDYLDQACPDAGYRLCAWRPKLTADSDQFLWDPAGPFWSDDASLADFAAEASRIVAATVATAPLRVATDAARNAARQLGRLQLGDTLVPDHLDEAVRPRIETWFPEAELRRYDASQQRSGQLAQTAQRLVGLQLGTLGIAAIAATALIAAGLRRRSDLADFTALILVAAAANAFATGALSTVHDRYETRIAWLLLLPPLIALLRRSPLGGNDLGRASPAEQTAPSYAASRATSSGDIRTSASYSCSNVPVIGPGV